MYFFQKKENKKVLDNLHNFPEIYHLQNYNNVLEWYTNVKSKKVHFFKFQLFFNEISADVKLVQRM